MVGECYSQTGSGDSSSGPETLGGCFFRSNYANIILTLVSPIIIIEIFFPTSKIAKIYESFISPLFLFLSSQSWDVRTVIERLIVSLILYSLIGMIIGFIVGKIKNR